LERLGTVAIIGVGLIGGSIGLALRSKGLAGRVVGIGRDASRLDEARRLGAIDAFETDLARGVADAEVAVVCTPVTRIVEDILEAAHHGSGSTS
jgi:prephenate dehydrogenase